MKKLAFSIILILSSFSIKAEDSITYVFNKYFLVEKGIPTPFRTEKVLITLTKIKDRLYIQSIYHTTLNVEEKIVVELDTVVNNVVYFKVIGSNSQFWLSYGKDDKLERATWYRDKKTSINYLK